MSVCNCWAEGGVQMMALAPAAMVSRMLSGVLPPGAMSGRLG